MTVLTATLPSTETAADYRQRRIYRDADLVPVIINGAEVGQILVQDILPPTANQSEG